MTLQNAWIGAPFLMVTMAAAVVAITCLSASVSIRSILAVRSAVRRSS